MSSVLLEKIKADFANSQKSRDSLKVSVFRMLLSELHNQEIAKRGELVDEDVVMVLKKEAKKRNESVAAYRQGGREDLATKEEQELKILSVYLPEQMSEAEIEKVVIEAVAKTGAKGPTDFGNVMKEAMTQLKGRCDGKIVSDLVKKHLIS